jgi:2-keto-4-pentenoate hydratase
MKHKIIRCILVLFLIGAWIIPISGEEIPVSQLADILIKAHNENQKIPVLSIQYPGLDVKTAYMVQNAYVKQRLTKDTIAGFKAGLTAEVSWKRFGLKGPVAGVLFASGKRNSNCIIDKNAFKTLMMEIEIGFIIGKSISHPLQDTAELKDHTWEVAPVIELPELGFADMQKLKGPDIIAANIGAAQFIVGEKQKINILDLDALQVTLKRNGEVVNQGKGEDTLGHQWKAALWLINTMVKQGWEIEPGHIIITGALGRMVPGKPGNYIADYGSLGTIPFKID